MTDPQFLELAGRIFSRTWEHTMIEECEDEWFYKAGESKLLKFARAIYTEGQTEGFKAGYDEGWESADESAKMNTTGID